MSTLISKNFEETRTRIDTLLRVEKSFDVIHRKITIGGRDASFFLIDGLVKDAFQKLLIFLCGIKENEMPNTAEEMAKSYIPYFEVDLIKKESDLIKQVFSGVPCLFIDGYDMGFAIDMRTYPARSVEEPDKEKVLRGSKDGFVETVVFNTALIRRRIRDPRLTMEILEAGDISKTDIVLCYMTDKIDKSLLARIRAQIQSIKISSLTMNQESLAECLYQRSWINPFPKFKFTERPDTAAASVLEGDLVILVDNSPSAMILPSSVFEIMDEANDYYFPPITGTYLRLSRYIINLITLLLTPTFLLLIQNPHWLPETFRFIMLREEVNIPLLWQLLILEFAIDGLKLASVNTPSMLSTPLSVIAGLVIGEFSVSSGWFNSEVMLYMAFVAVANYSQVNYEMGYALKFFRVLILILTASFDIFGYTAGLLITAGCLIFNKTIAGKSWLYPIIPFNGRDLMAKFFRVTLPRSENK